MGPGIIIPLVLVGVVVPTAIVWAKKRFKDAGDAGDDAVAAPGIRLTSNALRDLPSPAWRVVYEVAAAKLGGVEHVVVGPAGVFAVTTSMDPLPDAPTADPSPRDVAQAAVMRGDLDDALRRCAMESNRLIVVHWGRSDGSDAPVEILPGVTAVAGRALGESITGLPDDVLAPAQVDLAWQTVLTAIGRPDPLA